MPTTQTVTPYQVITDRILALLEQGTVPWQQPWDSTLGLPRNLFSQHAYRGINVWLLTAMGFPSPFWATFQQVKAAGGRVRTGAHGVPVVFWRVYDHTDPETGAADKRFVLRQYTVFNASQLDGVAIPAITVLAHRFTPIERCASLVDAMPQRPTILHGHPRACYMPATDTLHLPHPTCFHSPEAYYATVFHEVVHSVGHRTRLNRPTLTDPCRFGEPTYAKEELVAEMGTAYLCGVCGIANATIENSVAYLQSWMRVLRHDAILLVHAAAQAQRAADYIQNLHPAPGTLEESASIPTADHTQQGRAATPMATDRCTLLPILDTGAMPAARGGPIGSRANSAPARTQRHGVPRRPTHPAGHDPAPREEKHR